MGEGSFLSIMAAPRSPEFVYALKVNRWLMLETAYFAWAVDFGWTLLINENEFMFLACCVLQFPKSTSYKSQWNWTKMACSSQPSARSNTLARKSVTTCLSKVQVSSTDSTLLNCRFSRTSAELIIVTYILYRPHTWPKTNGQCTPTEYTSP